VSSLRRSNRELKRHHFDGFWDFGEIMRQTQYAEQTGCSEPAIGLSSSGRHWRGVADGTLAAIRMRALILFVLLLSGCRSLPSAYSARQQFERTHPQFGGFSRTKCEVFEPLRRSRPILCFVSRPERLSSRGCLAYQLHEYGWFRVQENKSK